MNKKKQYKDVKVKKTYNEMDGFLTSIVENVENLPSKIELQENTVWVLYGTSETGIDGICKADEVVCLQVGASKNEAKKEILTNVSRMMNGKFNIKFVANQDLVNKHSQFYQNAYQAKNIKNKNGYLYRHIYNNFDYLKFYELKINEFIDKDDEKIISNIEELPNVNKKNDEIRMFYAEAKFAYETQCLFWNTLNCGIDNKALQKLIKRDKETTEILNK